MMSFAARTVKAVALLYVSVSVSSMAQAQVVSTTPLPVRTFIDNNGVDIFTGRTMNRSPVLIAGGSKILSFHRLLVSGVGIRDNIQGGIVTSSNQVTVVVGESSEVFNNLGNNQYQPVEQFGSTLTGNGTNFTYKTAEGTTYAFSQIASQTANGSAQWGGGPVIQSMQGADGSALFY